MADELPDAVASICSDGAWRWTGLALRIAARLSLPQGELIWRQHIMKLARWGPDVPVIWNPILVRDRECVHLSCRVLTKEHGRRSRGIERCIKGIGGSQYRHGDRTALACNERCWFTISGETKIGDVSFNRGVRLVGLSGIAEDSRGTGVIARESALPRVDITHLARATVGAHDVGRSDGLSPNTRCRVGPQPCETSRREESPDGRADDNA